MPTLFVNSFGSYAYGNNLGKWEEQLGYRHRSSRKLDKDGAFTAGSFVDPRRLMLSGVINSTDGTNQTFRNLWDAFKGAHIAGSPRALQLDSDRYINAEVEVLSFTEWKGMPWVAWECTMVAFDPFWYANASMIQTLNVGAGTAVVTGGTVNALPVFTVVVSAPGTISISNAAGDGFVFTPTAAGTYIIDSTQEALTLAGVDSTAIWLSGVYLDLAYGGDTITVATSAGAAVSYATVGWQSRWN